KDLHQVSAAGFAALFPEFFMPAELDARPPLRFRASQARMLQVIGAVLHVCAQLLVRIVLDAPAVDQRSDERAKRRQQVHISSGCEPAVFASLSRDRKSTRLNSSHVAISYAVFCLKKKKQAVQRPTIIRTT